MRSLFVVVLSVSVLSVLLSLSACVNDSDGPRDTAPKLARVLAAVEPEAKIAALPDEVSNGTWCYLDAKNSTYANGTVDHYYWELYLRGVLKNTYDVPAFQHKFRQLGLWKIFLTITTNDSKTAEAFTAVYSIPDADADLLPDWWEIKYFNVTSQTGEDDYDDDGYSNLQEYASGMDPSSKNSGALVAMILDAWYYLVVVAAVAALAAMIAFSKLKKKRKAEVKKQIEAAIEIEKALEEEK